MEVGALTSMMLTPRQTNQPKRARHNPSFPRLKNQSHTAGINNRGVPLHCPVNFTLANFTFGSNLNSGNASFDCKTRVPINIGTF